MTYVIKVICCVCKEHYGSKSGGNVPGHESHGYCPSCFDLEMKKIKELKKETRHD